MSSSQPSNLINAGSLAFAGPQVRLRGKARAALLVPQESIELSSRALQARANPSQLPRQNDDARRVRYIPHLRYRWRLRLPPSGIGEELPRRLVGPAFMAARIGRFRFQVCGYRPTHIDLHQIPRT